jgi:hypothetical protein
MCTVSTQVAALIEEEEMKMKILGFALLSLTVFVGVIGCAREVSPTITPMLTPTFTPTLPPTTSPVSTPTAMPTALFVTVNVPQNESILSSANIEVVGITSPGAVVSVSVDGDLAIANVDANGNFDAMVTLLDGPNFIEVVASDQQGHEESSTITVVYIP